VVKEKEIRIVLFMLFFVALLLHEGLGYFVNFISEKTGIQFLEANYGLIEVGKYLASILFIFFSFTSRWIIKISGFEYIGGEYVGMSNELKDTEEVTKSQHEKFVIFQSLLSTSISGVTTLDNEEFYANWRGDLIEKKDNYYTFTLEVESAKRKHFGLITLRFEKDKVTGFTSYYDPGTISFKESLVAKRVSEKTR